MCSGYCAHADRNTARPSSEGLRIDLAIDAAQHLLFLDHVIGMDNDGFTGRTRRGRVIAAVIVGTIAIITLRVRHTGATNQQRHRGAQQGNPAFCHGLTPLFEPFGIQMCEAGGAFRMEPQ